MWRIWFAPRFHSSSSSTYYCRTSFRLDLLRAFTCARSVKPSDETNEPDPSQVSARLSTGRVLHPRIPSAAPLSRSSCTYRHLSFMMAFRARPPSTSAADAPPTTHTLDILAQRAQVAFPSPPTPKTTSTPGLEPRCRSPSALSSAAPPFTRHRTPFMRAGRPTSRPGRHSSLPNGNTKRL